MDNNGGNKTIIAIGDIIIYISIVLLAERIGVPIFNVIFKIPMQDFIKYIIISIYGLLWLIGIIVYTTEKSKQGD